MDVVGVVTFQHQTCVVCESSVIFVRYIPGYLSPAGLFSIAYI